jgi:hypothetical protein
MIPFLGHQFYSSVFDTLLFFYASLLRWRSGHGLIIGQKDIFVKKCE